MNKSIIVVICFLLLAGCSIERPHKPIVIKGAMKELQDAFFIYGKSNLPKNAILQFTLIEANNDKIVEEREIKVGEEGIYQWGKSNLQREVPYRLDIKFDPKKQNKAITILYGEKGQFIKKDKNAGVVFEKQSDESNVIVKLYVDIHLSIKSGGYSYFYTDEMKRLNEELEAKK